MDVLQVVEHHKIVAIFRGVSGEAADRGAEALLRGGIKVLEVTMNTEGAMNSLERWRKAYEGEAYFGAGTVLDLEMAKVAVAAGAQFLISPNLDEEVVRYGIEQGVDVFPGVMTPTEIVRAWKAGARAVKLFPMASLGIGYLKDIRAPLDQIPMIVTGGVNLDNIADFVKAGVAGVGLGSNLVDKKLIAEGKFDELEANARKYVEAVAAASR
ncbi:bifunctional 4-hydroxy-2-oxoglutarate aldolase/2-dehydro-3-deoxy-phosphogluconate aldolase [Paenibacillus sp.]|uniref:bifunctional 4-hydroxy-2-oxoglutarate aldolase/2-dehydro-3-deoxy-phosphogluconate aldolase n=1 Tax=Paenibacillus sp. TaxID=58172 RepID=UPI002D2B7746|nr:bifunctional 4-hydroxy-2-oxoglutarate aldolase/2-dehydro-3-deoxy-phosphogluconate aldolase [Paenibacillus sp.]HZG58794.1 bifunctional 4-hydroxy-2-oxoglutarate aldolase/2-dehydro-3-deoxy-phosphogluconate aldolase [Paenibacillus sp.]